MILEAAATVLAVGVAYLLAGIVTAAVFGGRDPLTFAPWPAVVAWPALWLLVWVAHDVKQEAAPTADE